MRKNKEEQNYSENLKQKYYKAVLKRKVCYGFVYSSIISFIISMGFFVTSMAYSVSEDYGYRNFNEKYKAQQVEQLKDDVKNGIVDVEDYAQKKNQIKDYDYKQYIQSLDEETKEKALEQDEKSNTFGWMSVGIMGVTCATSAIGIPLLIKSEVEEKRLKEKINNYERSCNIFYKPITRDDIERHLN